MTGDLVERLRGKIDEREKRYRQLIERPYTYAGMNINGVSRQVLVGLGIFGVDEHEWLRTIQAHRAILDALKTAVELREASARRFARHLERGEHAQLQREKAAAMEAHGTVVAFEHAVEELASIYFPEGTE